MIVVGTHIDLVPRTEREEKVKLWQEMVNCYSSNRAHSHLYPHIMGVCFVGYTSEREADWGTWTRWSGRLYI